MRSLVKQNLSDIDILSDDPIGERLDAALKWCDRRRRQRVEALGIPPHPFIFPFGSLPSPKSPYLTRDQIRHLPGGIIRLGKADGIDGS